MNTLKSLVIIGVLGVVGYGVWVTLNGSPPPERPDWLPPDVASGMGELDVELGDSGLPAVGGPDDTFGAPSGSSEALGRYDSAPADRYGSAPTDRYGAADGPLASADGASSLPTPVTNTPNLNQAVDGGGNIARADYGDNAPGAQASAGSVYGQPRNDSPTADGAATDRYADRGNAGPTAATPAGYDAQLASAEVPSAGSVYRRGDDPQQAADDLAAASTFGAAMENARLQMNSGDLPTALAALSAWYDHPRLSPAEDQQLNQLLDQLAGVVIYSRKSLLELPHRVSTVDRLEDVAAKYNVTPQLLAKINGLDPQSRPAPNSELKVIRGPFHAQINVTKNTLTLMVGDRYAGRFPLRTARGFQPTGQQYFVVSKSLNPRLARADGSEIVSGSRDYVPVSRGLELASGATQGTAGRGERIWIVGSDNHALFDHSQFASAIVLSERDADDVYDILTEQSRVTIGR